MVEEVKKTVKPTVQVAKPGYSMPSQSLLKWIEARQAKGEEITPFNISLSVELAILDKLEEILHAIRAGNNTI